MISTSINPAATELNIRSVTFDAAMVEDMYATTPVAVVLPTYRQLNEEELHTSFEEAISDRVLAVNKQLRRLSGTMTGHSYVESQTCTAVKQGSLADCFLALGRAGQRGILFVAIAFMLVMVGFDLMGLMVLHMQ